MNNRFKIIFYGIHNGETNEQIEYYPVFTWAASEYYRIQMVILSDLSHLFQSNKNTTYEYSVKLIDTEKGETLFRMKGIFTQSKIDQLIFEAKNNN